MCIWFKEPECDNFDIFFEYHTAAIIGQKLFEMAEAFAYYVPSIYRRQSFAFDIEIKDQEKLAGILSYIITGLSEQDVDFNIKFYEETTKLFTETFGTKNCLSSARTSSNSPTAIAINQTAKPLHFQTMDIKNYTSSIEAQRSLALIEELLVEIGATNINKQYQDKVCTGITFLLYDPQL